VVTDSMMPEGVEHNNGGQPMNTTKGVTDSMMPEGVEHHIIFTCLSGWTE